MSRYPEPLVPVSKWMRVVPTASQRKSQGEREWAIIRTQDDDAARSEEVDRILERRKSLQRPN